MKKRYFSFVSHVLHNQKPIGSRWVFSIKSDGRYKARFVAQGFRQILGIDYFDTYSPTLSMDPLRILLVISTYLDYQIHQIDAKIAYLEGELDEEVFMKCPQGLEGTGFVRLNKSLMDLNNLEKPSTKN